MEKPSASDPNTKIRRLGDWLKNNMKAYENKSGICGKNKDCRQLFKIQADLSNLYKTRVIFIRVECIKQFYKHFEGSRSEFLRRCFEDKDWTMVDKGKKQNLRCGSGIKQKFRERRLCNKNYTKNGLKGTRLGRK